MIRPGLLFMECYYDKKDVIKLLEQIATYMELKGKILLKYQRIEKQLKVLN